MTAKLSMGLIGLLPQLVPLHLDAEHSAEPNKRFDRIAPFRHKHFARWAHQQGPKRP